MRRTSVWLGVCLVLVGWMTFSVSAIGADRTAEEILKEFDESRKQAFATPMSCSIRTSDPAYQEVLAKSRERRATLFRPDRLEPLQGQRAEA